ncbi:ArsR family transcriptional regulator [Streptomyces sp. SID8379]|uniref:helix-turn-helix domain-containing protein n=1 Tax=unclassified Streptomyces TaxID=2593676 RepID=UPI00035EC124|nr:MULTISPECIES: helix-turn-helix domain-containing protein [unclassified Streptomyces]MYW68612.1 ArsR family transcriptional regulator [Streptomyces sp. SID8379]
MGIWQVDADTLAGSRFVVSSLAETTASLKKLADPTAAHPGERRWLDTHLPAYRARLAADPVTAALVGAALGRTWTADFLTPTPYGVQDLDLDEGLGRIRATSADAVRADLTVSSPGPPPSALVRADDLAERAATLLEWVWRTAVRPEWPRRRRVIEADVVARTRELTVGGWAAAFAAMRPTMRWLGDGRLRINAHDHPPRDISGARLLFVPVTPQQGWVSWPEPPAGSVAPADRYAVVYPCAGALADADRSTPPGALATLLGTARAQVLVLLERPLTTTQLVALTGQGLGSVGRHLKVLLDARLVGRRRAGRSVLYFRTATGDTLLDAQRETDDRAPDPASPPAPS